MIDPRPHLKLGQVNKIVVRIYNNSTQVLERKGGIYSVVYLVNSDKPMSLALVHALVKKEMI